MLFPELPSDAEHKDSAARDLGVVCLPKASQTSRPWTVSVVKNLQKTLVFAKESLLHPRSVGALVPSSLYLAEAMARCVKRPSGSWVLELGAGTGSVTRALLRQGIPPQRLIVVEQSLRLVHLLTEQFPRLLIIHGDAQELRGILRATFGQVCPLISHVVSSLPFRSLSPLTRSRLEREIELVLPPGGKVIQFTYDLRPWARGPFEAFHKGKGATVWRNLPPARIDWYQKP
ncbi:class I SAM-dependent methyltransferase [Candidatus Methylacidithermus pantelleriae]|uniref:Putative Phosphatidylethanolamine N-methyltransferase n=1 Tax=Candidatus Methylacidithermus pantelleriae TaxID=2744239 RepID=A0A8J2BLY9_9BACT|nr:hypothetical protein [Candidatus Methylacidithermus pantelleriae]CAF0704502.1 putative Phosphatidylethanolamine N-methyltransferase [Candidatus Methylacidithermus pantelleriae]